MTHGRYWARVYMWAEQQDIEEEIMANVNEEQCRTRHESERTMYFNAMSDVKKNSLPRWVFILTVGALLTVAVAVAGVIYSGVLDAKRGAIKAHEEARNNETALARVEESTKGIARDMDRMDKAMTEQRIILDEIRKNVKK